SDYFVLASGNSDVQVKAIAEHVVEELKKAGVRPLHVEGMTGGRWVLLDYVDFVVHVFHPEARAFYQLETLWGDAPRWDAPEPRASNLPAGSRSRTTRTSRSRMVRSRAVWWRCWRPDTTPGSPGRRAWPSTWRPVGRARGTGSCWRTPRSSTRRCTGTSGCRTRRA